jgi:hypothetical protein
MTAARPICSTPGCGNLARNKGRSESGAQRFDHVCHRCHRQAETSPKYVVDNSKCELCGWDKAPCDRHRIKPEAGYRRGNVIVLCPNCHRLVTLGRVSLEAVA